MGKLAWRSREAAAAEAAMRFGPRGWRIIRGAFETSQLTGDFSNDLAAGLAHVRKAAPLLDRAAKLLRRAQCHVTDARRGPWRRRSAEEVGAPPSLASLGALAQAVGSAAAEVGAFAREPAQREDLTRAWLVRSADAHGVRGRASDWCYAFIALGLMDHFETAHDFSRNMSTWASDAKDAGLPLLAKS